jgi:hypothetical protein
MSNNPTPEHLALAQQLLAIAAGAMADPESPGVDWHDDQDIGILYLVSAAVAIADAIDTRDDFANGLVSGRVCIVLDAGGATLVERATAA